ncbi:MAG: UvrB/UvrC motif-containing protein, partial [Candidatus Pacebacteria bacterium]|nr:UvrB/UvrC motif-containing protein [Candidatus Paceibacterota bacterium]
ISRKDYLKNIKSIKDFLKGKKKKIINDLEREMKERAKKMEFEKAERIRRKLNFLYRIRDIALVDFDSYLKKEKKERWEGYDISNISGVFAVGSMAVFINQEPEKKEYKRFKIRTIKKANDTAMLKEVIERRFKNNWTFPDLILIDGGKGQKNIVEKTLNDLGITIPVISIAKGKERKKNEFFGKVPENADKKKLIYLRDEAHRFAINYHRKLREDLKNK